MRACERAFKRLRVVDGVSNAFRREGAAFHLPPAQTASDRAVLALRWQVARRDVKKALCGRDVAASDFIVGMCLVRRHDGGRHSFR